MAFQNPCKAGLQVVNERAKSRLLAWLSWKVPGEKRHTVLSRHRFQGVRAFLPELLGANPHLTEPYKFIRSGSLRTVRGPK